MSLKSRFLQLEITQQIEYCVTALILLIALFIIGILGSYSYEVLNQSYLQQTNYFNEMQDKYLNSLVLFADLNLVLYEDITKLLIEQSYNFFINSNLYTTENIYSDEYLNNHIYLIENNQDNSNETENENEGSNNSSIFYLYFYKNYSNESYLNLLKFNLIKGIPILDVIRNFHLSIWGNTNLTDDYTFAQVKMGVIMSLNKELVKAIINHTHEEIEIYFNDLTNNHLNENKEFLSYNRNNDINFLDLIYPKFNKFYRNVFFDVEDYLFPIMNYTSGMLTIIDNSIADAATFIASTGIIPNFLEKMFFKGSTTFKNFYNIAINMEDELISKQSCYYLIKIHSIYDNLTDEDTKILYNKIQNDTSIKNCFYANIFKEQMDNMTNEYKLLTLNNTRFSFKKLLQSHSTINELKVNEIFIHYFPELFDLILFKPLYPITQKLTIFSFYNSHNTSIFCKNVWNILNNTLLLVLIFLLFIWIILFIILKILTYRLSIQITKPIIKLKESIENNILSDENIFIYKDDDIINDFFSTCKELLKGEFIIKKKNVKEIDNNFGIGNDNVNNIIINNKMIQDAISNNNIIKNKKEEFKHSEDKSFSEKKRKVTPTFSTNNLDNINEIKCNKDKIILDSDDYNNRQYKNLLKMGETVFQKKNSIFLNNLNEEKSDSILLNKKCIYYYWYMDIKKQKKYLNHNYRDCIILNSKNKISINNINKPSLFNKKIFRKSLTVNNINQMKYNNNNDVNISNNNINND